MVCVFTYTLASAFTPMVTWEKMNKHKPNTATYCQMVGGVCHDSAAQALPLFIKQIIQVVDLTLTGQEQNESAVKCGFSCKFCWPGVSQLTEQIHAAI